MSHEFYSDILRTIEFKIKNDPLNKCDSQAITNIILDPDSALQVANERIHVFPYKDVDLCWKRLYTDAGMSKAINLITGTNKPSDWLDQVVKQLDMVLIMTGAPLREEMVESILTRLQIDNEEQNLNWPDSFSETSLRKPQIVFPVSACPMTFQQFQKHLQAPRPNVIKGAIQHWPALSSHPWKSPSYLRQKTFNGRRLVPVELGRSYTDDDWGQTIISFSEFLDRYISGSDTKVGYLAQHDLFSQIPSLRDDIYIPDFCYSSPPAAHIPSSLYGKSIDQLEEPLLNAWFGPAGTISPLHTDSYHNILCQVVGKKYVRLYSPDQTSSLYPRSVENGIDMSNTSRIPIELVEMSLGPDDDFPLFDEAQYIETILNEGDSLYIPAGWWHYVRSLSISFSVSFWWN